jgi:recombination protein RecA
MANIVFSQPDTAEQALSIIDALAGSGQISLVVLDSVAKLAPKKEVE